MVKITLGRRGERLKRNFFFLGILLIVLLGSCLVCSRIDWASFQRSAFEQYLLEREEAIVLLAMPPEGKVRKLLGECHSSLRSRWLTGYFYIAKTGQYHFVGRTASKEFRDAVLAQKAQIDAGEPFDRKKIPRFRMVVDFKRLDCRLVVAEYAQPGM